MSALYMILLELVKKRQVYAWPAM